MTKERALYEAITAGNRKGVAALVGEALEEGRDVGALLDEEMIPAMGEIGERFSRNDIYVPEMLISARAMQAGLDIIEPRLAAAGREPRGRVCIGTVMGDLHDIGKNLVAIMLKGAGFEVDDLGANCSIERFDEAVGRGASVVCTSALLTTTMPYMKDVVEHFRGRDGVSVLIGGAPITREYADEIGADGFGKDAHEAVGCVEACFAAGA